uniref:Cyclin N-terminal domain-containing protein n=1 Tax=Panagrolaimus superbus TaxID=310955 RepID=A0A914YC47_9BILA
MPKRKKTDDEENCSAFRRYSLELHKQSKRCKRDAPPLMETPDLGAPEQVWSLLCSKDELNERNWRGLKKQLHITTQARCMIVDWLMEVAASLKLHRETFHLAVDYFDRYLCVAKEQIPLIHLQLVATSALAVACKFEEIYPPKLNVLADFTDGACNANQVVLYEQILLTELEWNFNPVTIIHWLAFYLQLLAKTNENAFASVKKVNRVSSHLFNEDSDDGMGAHRSFSDSFLRSIDGVNDALNETVESFSGTKKSDTDGHVYIGQSLCIPKLFRDDFIQLAKVVDLLILDFNFLSFRYSELAAAVLFCSYQSSEDIEKITSIKRDSISKLISMVQIFVDYCEGSNNISHKSFVIEDIEHDEVHNIQRFEDNNYETLKEVITRQKEKMAELNKIQKTFKEQKLDDVVLKEHNS